MMMLVPTLVKLGTRQGCTRKSPFDLTSVLKSSMFGFNLFEVDIGLVPPQDVYQLDDIHINTGQPGSFSGFVESDNATVTIEAVKNMEDSTTMAGPDFSPDDKPKSSAQSWHLKNSWTGIYLSFVTFSLPR